MKTYLITLDKNYSSKKKYLDLLKTGLKPEIIPGIIPTKKQLREYSFRPKGVIGSYLAHKSVWEIISKNDSEALILEDDVVPLFKNASEIDKLRVPKNGILKIHTELMFGPQDSAAAYILSNFAAKSLLNKYKMYLGYCDWDMYFNATKNGIKVKITNDNMFFTDETKSTGRSSGNNILYDFINAVFPPPARSQKTMKNAIDYKIIRFGDTEISGNQIIYLVVTAILLKLSIKDKKYLVLLTVFLLIIFEY